MYIQSRKRKRANPTVLRRQAGRQATRKRTNKRRMNWTEFNWLTDWLTDLKQFTKWPRMIGSHASTGGTTQWTLTSGWFIINTNNTPAAAAAYRPTHSSASQGDLVVPRTRTAGFGPRSFSVAGPLAWNSLPPPEIKTTSLTLGQFSSRLKTEMFLYVAATACQRSRHNLL